MFQQVDNRLGLANTRRAQGNLSQQLNDLNDAAAFLGEAADLFEQTESRLGLANTRQAQGDLAQRGDELAAAEGFYKEAADLFERAQDRRGQANTCRVRGDLARYRGDLNAAETFYQGAAEIFGQPGNRIALADTRHAQGDLAFYCGDLNAAEAFYRRAAELFERVQDQFGLAKTRLVQGELAQRCDDLTSAETWYREAAQLYGQVQNRLGLANVRLVQGHLAKRRGDLDAAVAFYQDAAGLNEQAQNRLGLSNTFCAQGGIGYFRDDLAGAGRLYAMAFGQIRVGRVPNYTSVAAAILANWASLHLKANRPNAAWLRARAALRLYDGLLALQPSATDREIYRRSAANATAVAVASALQLAAKAETNQDDAATVQNWRLQAWRVAERHRSAVLLSLFEAGTALRQTRLRPEEQADLVLRTLLERLAEVEVDLGRLLAVLRLDVPGLTDRAAGDGPDVTPSVGAVQRTTPSLAVLATQADQRASLDAERRHLLRELRTRDERLGAAAGDLEPPLERLLAILQAQQAGIVSNVLLPDGAFAALVLRPDGNVQHVGLGQRTVNDTVFAALVNEGRHRFWTPWAQWDPRGRRAFERLGQDLWAPLEKSGALAGLAHLYLVPDGWLRLLPFAALSWVEQADDHRLRRHHVVEEHPFSVLLAGGTLAHIAEASARAQSQPSDLAAVVDPARTYAPVWPEAVLVMRQALAPQVPLEGAVDHAAFIQAINTAGGLLYFGHGTVGGLVLSDGLFGGEDVLAQLDMRGPALLGACLLGLEHAMEGLAGASTVSALHLIGCPTVLGALWEVPARETVVLLDRVRTIGGTGPGGWAEAHRHAQLALRAQDASPTACWAAFALYGSPFA